MKNPQKPYVYKTLYTTTHYNTFAHFNFFFVKIPGTNTNVKNVYVIKGTYNIASRKVTKMINLLEPASSLCNIFLEYFFSAML